jgi:catechol-2,3-dioxygenase
MAKPQLSGFGHIDLTVTDGERSARWWQDVMGFTQITFRERPDFKVWGLMDSSGVYVGLMTHSGGDGERFGEQRVGLDHLAFRVADRDALEQWVRHLDSLDVQHSGIQDEVGGPLLVLRDPDNIQLELHAVNLTDPAVTDLTAKAQVPQR